MCNMGVEDVYFELANIGLNFPGKIKDSVALSATHLFGLLILMRYNLPTSFFNGMLLDSKYLLCGCQLFGQLYRGGII